MNLSPDDLRCLWLLFRWGFPLLAAVLISYMFAANYLHERAEEARAIAELAKQARKLGLAEALRGMSEGKPRAEPVGLLDRSRTSTEAATKACANPNHPRPGWLPNASCGRVVEEEQSETPATSVKRWRVRDKSIFQRRTF